MNEYIRNELSMIFVDDNQIEKLMSCVNYLGKYEIIYLQGYPISLIKVLDNHFVALKHLLPNQYIEFTLEDYRNYQIERVLL
jgi:hypothetical protein